MSDMTFQKDSVGKSHKSNPYRYTTTSTSNLQSSITGGGILTTNSPGSSGKHHSVSPNLKIQTTLQEQTKRKLEFNEEKASPESTTENNTTPYIEKRSHITQNNPTSTTSSKHSTRTTAFVLENNYTSNQEYVKPSRNSPKKFFRESSENHRPLRTQSPNEQLGNSEFERASRNAHPSNFLQIQTQTMQSDSTNVPYNTQGLETVTSACRTVGQSTVRSNSRGPISVNNMSMASNNRLVLDNQMILELDDPNKVIAMIKEMRTQMKAKDDEINDLKNYKIRSEFNVHQLNGQIKDLTSQNKRNEDNIEKLNKFTECQDKEIEFLKVIFKDF